VDVIAQLPGAIFRRGGLIVTRKGHATVGERGDELGAFRQGSHDLCGCKVETCDREWSIVRSSALRWVPM
jgi:hypothetical protein